MTFTTSRTTQFLTGAAISLMLMAPPLGAETNAASQINRLKSSDEYLHLFAQANGPETHIAALKHIRRAMGKFKATATTKWVHDV